MNEPRLPRERYHVLGLLGTGGMASVWRVLDVRLNAERAVKVLPQGVLREAQLAAALNHPHIVSVHDVLDAPEGACVVMELAQGSVADHVATHGPLAPRVAATLMADIADALAAAHAAGVVHRDVKPQNLLVFTGGPVKLGDFGIAALLEGDAPAESTQAILGSVPFMAPEQRRGQALPASDVYAAAVSLAWMLTGDLPGDLYVDTVRDALRQRLGAEAAPLVEVLAAAGAHAPEARLTAEELATALRAYGGEASARLDAVTRPATPAAPSGRWVRVGGDALRPKTRLSPSRLGIGVAVGTLVCGAVALQRVSPTDVVTDSDAVLQLREYERLPTCTGMPTRMELQIAPRWETAEPGGREASGGRILDIDGDGRRDLLFGHGIQEEFRVFWGLGAKFVDEPQRVAALRMVQLQSAVVDAADVDGDGLRDLVGLSPEEMAFVLVRATRARQYASPVRVETGGVPKSLRAVDWDGDGLGDLVYAVALDNGGKVMWRRSLGNGTFDAERDLAGAVDAFDVLTAPTGQAVALIVAIDGRVLRYRVQPDARRSAEPDLDIRVPGAPAGAVRVLSGSNEVHLWQPWTPHSSVRVSLNDGSACRYDLGVTPLHDIGYFDDDSLLDATASLTCNYCTSSYQLWLGSN